MTQTEPALGIPDDWYVACEARALGGEPLGVSMWGTRLVLFRDPSGAPAALLDRCAHRNVPLSMGDCHRGEVECPYHGWRFDRRGECTAVPGLVSDLRKGARGRHVPSFASREEGGYIWVYSTPDVEPVRDPFALSLVGRREYTTITHVQDFDGSVAEVAENALDVPHTAYVHRGLFRGGGTSARSTIDVELTQRAERIEAEYIGEERPEGLIGKLLAPGGGTVVHFDRFVLPCVAQVEYRLGEDSHVVATTMLTPIAEGKSRMFASVSFRMPVPKALIGAFSLAAKPLALRILGQDVRILARLTENVRHFGGEHYASTELDVLGPGIRKLLRTAASGERESAAPPTVRRLQMRV